MANVTNALPMLKANLGFFDTAIDSALETYLTSRLNVAVYELEENCELTLDDSQVADLDLIAMYAAWLYRKSVTGEAKPPMLQMAIRNRQVNTPASLEESL